MSETNAEVEGRARILVVDDEAIVLELLVDLLEDAGFEVFGTVSAIEALRKTKTSAFDAMVLDLYMPEMPGMLLHAKVKVTRPALAERTLFVSGHFTRDELRREMEHSAHFLPKPFTPAELVEAVRAVLDTSEGSGTSLPREATG